MAHFIFGGIGVKLDGLLQEIVSLGNPAISYDGVVDGSKIYQLRNLEQVKTLRLQPHDNVWLFYTSATDLTTLGLKNGDVERVISDLERWYCETKNVVELKIANPLLQLIDIAEISANLTSFLKILDLSKKEVSSEACENTAITNILIQNTDISTLIVDLETKSTKFNLVSTYLEIKKLAAQYEHKLNESLDSQEVLESKLAESVKSAQLNQEKVAELTKVVELNRQTHKSEIDKLTSEYEHKFNEEINRQKVLKIELAESVKSADSKYEELKEKSIRLLEEKIKEINSLKDEKNNLEQRNFIQQSQTDKLEAEIHRLTVLNQGLNDDNTNLNHDLLALRLEVKDLTEKLQASGKRSEIVEKQAVRAAAQIDIIKELILTDTNNSDFLKLK